MDEMSNNVILGHHEQKRSLSHVLNVEQNSEHSVIEISSAITEYILHGEIDVDSIKTSLISNRSKLTIRESELIFRGMRGAMYSKSYITDHIASERLTYVSHIFSDILEYEIYPSQKKPINPPIITKPQIKPTPAAMTARSYDPMPPKVLEQAKCRRSNMQEVFLKTSASKEDRYMAKTACQNCVVVRNCLELGMSINAEDIIFGGYDGDEIRRLKAKYKSLKPTIKDARKVLPLESSHPDRILLDSVIDEAIDKLYTTDF